MHKQATGVLFCIINVGNIEQQIYSCLSYMLDYVILIIRHKVERQRLTDSLPGLCWPAQSVCSGPTDGCGTLLKAAVHSDNSKNMIL